MADFDLHFFDHLIMIIIGVFLPAMAIAGSRHRMALISITPAMKKRLYWSNSLVLWIGTIIVLAVWFGSGRSPQSLGLKQMIDDPPFLSYLLLASFIGLYLLDTLYHVATEKNRKNTIEKWKKHTPFLPQNWNEFNWFLIVAFTAGICEELIYRGFMINYLLVVFKHQSYSIILAVMIPALIFGVSHIYQGWLAVFKVIMMAMLFGYVFVFTESLFILIILHILVDIIGGLLSVLMLGKSGKVHPSHSEEE